MAKNPKSFRLSDKATDNLRWLVEASGSNETAVIELALAYFRQGFVPLGDVSDGWDVPVPEPDLPVSDLPSVKVLPMGQGTDDHKRKRRHRR